MVKLYLYYFFEVCTKDIIQIATVTTFKVFSGSQMGETIIPLPPLNEQRIICKLIEKLMKSLYNLEKNIQ